MDPWSETIPGINPPQTVLPGGVGTFDPTAPGVGVRPVAAPRGISLGLQWGPMWGFLLALAILVIVAVMLPGKNGIYLAGLMLFGYLAVHPQTLQSIADASSNAILATQQAITGV